MRRVTGVVLSACVALGVGVWPAAARGEMPESDFVSAARAALTKLKGVRPTSLANDQIVAIAQLGSKKLQAVKRYVNSKGWNFNGSVSFSPGGLAGFSADMQEESGHNVAVGAGAEVGGAVFVPISPDEIVTSVGGSGKLVMSTESRSIGVELSGGFTRTIRGKGYNVKVEKVIVIEQRYPDLETFQRAMPRLSKDADIFKIGMTRDIAAVFTGKKDIEDLLSGQATTPLAKIQRSAAIADTDILNFDRTRVSLGTRLVLTTPEGVPIPDPTKVGMSLKELASLSPVQLAGGITYMTHFDQKKNQPIGSGRVSSSIGRTYNVKVGAGKAAVSVGVAKSTKEWTLNDAGGDEHRRALAVIDMIQSGDHERFAEMIRNDAMLVVYADEIRKALDLLKEFGQAIKGIDPARLIANGVVIHYNPDLLKTGRPPAEIARALKELAENFKKGPNADNRLMLQAGPGRQGLKAVSLDKLLADPAAKTVGDLARIRGYVLDPSRDILLLGECNRSAPPIDINVLAVAARSALGAGSRYALVSLDPDPNDMEGPHKVRVEGLPPDLRNSEYARIMIEADYRMKLIGHGDLPLAVPGFKSLYRLLREGAAGTFRFSRFWLKPYQSRVADVWEHHAAGRQVVLFDSRVLVMTETMKKVGNYLRQTGRPNPTAEKAAAMFTDHYEAIAAQEPIFHKLAAVFDATKLCAIWRHERVKHPLIDKLLKRKIKVVKLKASYPGLKAKHIRSVPEGTVHFSRQGRRVGVLRLTGGASAELAMTDKSFMPKPVLAALAKAGHGDRVVLRLPATTRLTPAELVDQSADMQLGKGIDLYSDFRYVDALEPLNKAIKLDADLPGAYIYRGLCLTKLGRHAEALRDIDRLVAQVPPLIGLRACLRAMMGQAAGALSDADKAEKQYPDAEATLAWCAIARLYAFDMRGAERLLHRAMDKSPADTDLLGLQTMLTTMHRLGPVRARARLALVRAIPAAISDAQSAASEALLAFDFEKALAQGRACLKLIAGSGAKDVLARAHVREQVLMLLITAGNARAKMLSLLDPSQAPAAVARARTRCDELIRLRPESPVGYVMKARTSPKDAEAMRAAVKAFTAACKRKNADDPLLDEMRTLTGKHDPLVWLGISLVEKLDKRRSPEARSLVKGIMELLGQTPSGRMLQTLDTMDLREIRAFHAGLPEKITDPNVVDVWCLGSFCSALARLESERGNKANAARVAASYVRMTNVGGLDRASLRLVTMYRLRLTMVYAEARGVSFDDDPRVADLRRQIANGRLDPAQIEQVLAAVRKDILAGIAKDMSRLTAAFMDFAQVREARLATERALWQIADQYGEVDAESDEERAKLKPVLAKWKARMDRADPQKTKPTGTAVFAPFKQLADAAETTVEIHCVKTFAEHMMKGAGAVARRDPLVAGRINRAMSKLLERLRAKTVSARRTKLSWDGWPAPS